MVTLSDPGHLSYGTAMLRTYVGRASSLPAFVRRPGATREGDMTTGEGNQPGEFARNRAQRQAMRQLSPEQREALLESQSSSAKDYYEHNSEWREWLAGELVTDQ